ncbi:hypothetical protein [Vitiosangium sp. GDMCC 1.1324]|uniref:hypothetical protein n=1 Tax=Vitiosangium sp. (strain GDMCC 1.1324) TaxID=2138576 RepID=UPI0011B5B9CC|nr:hypothetical protein [Vitiosangium sp. GDMCC 1.1324]
MKRLMVIGALMVMPLGCVANQGDAALRFLNVRALKIEEGCTAASDKFITSGSLDLAGGQNYLMAPSVETNTSSTNNASSQGLDVTLTELIYSYSVSQAGIKMPADEVDRVPLYAVYRADTTPDASYLFMHAFGPKGFKVLVDAANAGAIGTEPVTVLATIKGRGYLSSGQTVESNEFTFPVFVYKSTDTPPTSCPEGFVLNGACGISGQDGTVGCVKAGP